GPYVGQVQLVLDALVPGVPVLDLISDLTPFRPDLAAYLLPALVRDTPRGTLFLCIVDPGVGGERAALALEADGRWFVGPDNGLLAVVARRAQRLRALRVVWRPIWLSQSFHGRDLFAPVAARICQGQDLAWEALDEPALVGWDWPEDLPRIVYRDSYGNLMTGWRAERLDQGATLALGGQGIGWARTFCEARPGAAFWYENAFGLVEIAVNQGRADLQLGIGPGADLVLG
ncbi:MAG TPA: SAM-dependent chlorinase/fluorinase, partial [Chromatiaceae bacterium]|nr:SAM-dependent chlorinase/fluorinase [Chromatiaceae bacterium]